MTPWIDHPFVQALASALLHFLWQGAVLALLAAAWWRIRPAARARYAGGVIALAAMLAAPVATMTYLAGAPAVPPSPPAAYAARSEAAPPRAAPSVTPAGPAGGEIGSDPAVGSARRAPGAVLVLPLWFAGVLVLSGRLVGGWIVAWRLTRRHVSPASPDLVSCASRMAGRLELRRAVRVVESSAVAVPVMLGWLKPVILVPTAVLTTLTPAQLEAVLAHELAHVRRHDYIANILQSLVETLLFYHPAVWWVSREVRAAREQCCDDLVVTVCDRVTYVTALSDLAALGGGPSVMLAATGGPLLQRVRRLLGHPHADRPAAGFWVPALLVILASTSLLPIVTASPVEQPPIAPGTAAGVPGGVAGGVGDGVSGGVVEGAPGSAPAGGAAEGIAGGMATGPRSRQQPEKPQEGAARAAEAWRAELRALLERERAANQQHLRQQGEMKLQQMEIALQGMKAALEGTLAEQNASLDNRRRKLQRAQARVAVGMGDTAEAEQLQNDLAVAELRLHVVRTEYDARLKQLMLRMEAARQELAHDLRQLDIEHARQLLELQQMQAGGADRVRSGLRQPSAADSNMHERVRAIEESLREALRGGGGRPPEASGQGLEATVEAVQTQPIAAGDVLAIEIGGEPALPRAYPVAQDGMITLPLLGALQAAGRTAAQVGEEIRRLLIERELKRDPSVTVQRRRRQ